MLGHRFAHLGQQLLVVFAVDLELAAVLLQDHLGRVGDALFLFDRAQLFDLIEDAVESLGQLENCRVDDSGCG